jgi:sigma-B regulation protein RsbU (phosphoserine phosphatase)
MSKKNFRNPLSKVFSGRTPGDDRAGEGKVAALEEEVRRLQQSVKTLSILNDLAVAMGTSPSPEKAVEKLVDRSMRAVNAEQAVVTLLDREVGSPMETQMRIVSSSAEHQSFHVNESLLGWMLLHKKPLLIGDPKNDERFKGLTWDDTIRSVMCLPMMMQSKLMGVLTVYNKKKQDAFNEEDERLTAIISAHAAQILDNARLAADQARVAEQLNLAAKIQRNLLPSSPPPFAGYDLAGMSAPAQSVGGDYYDYIPVDDSKLAVCLGDVSGKGLAASLLMANLQATLRGQTLVDAPAHERIERANKLICRCTDDERFVTLFYGVIDATAQELVFCSAGHEPPFLYSEDGPSKRLEPGGLALGVFEDVRYTESSIPLKPGDTLVVYSDGVTDATNEAEEPFGTERLDSLIGEHRKEPAAALIQRIFDGVSAHTGATPQFDDLTLLVVKRTN